MQILRLQPLSVCRASTSWFLVSRCNFSRVPTKLQWPSRTTRCSPCLPGSLRLGHQQREAGAVAAGNLISDDPSSVSRKINFSEGVCHGWKAMLRMLSVCAGWNLVRRNGHFPLRRPQRSSRECKSNEGEAISSSASGKSSEKQWDDEIPAEDAQFLASIRTRYNFVRVLEIAKTADHPMAGARVLLLDKFGNVHSLYHEYRLLTNSYYDVFPSLPAIIPDGPIGIFGLAAGTAARLVHHFWPEVDMYGWELDPAVVYVARKYFSLEELEWREASEGAEEEACAAPERQGFISPGSYRKWKRNNRSIFMENADVEDRPKGRLRVVVGDALSPDACVEGGFAGIVVDLFADGAVIPALQEPGVWREMKRKLRPGGRIMVNCGGSCVDAGLGSKDGRVTMEETIAAMGQEFPQQLCVLPLRCRGDNHIALTGPLPDLETWCQALPECLRIGCQDWITHDSRQNYRSK